MKYRFVFFSIFDIIMLIDIYASKRHHYFFELLLFQNIIQQNAAEDFYEH